MKYKTTRKQITQQYARIFQAGYCELNFIDNYFQKVAYNAGVYGWNWDAVAVGRAVVITGYRGMFGEELPEKARKILKNVNKYEATHRGAPYTTRDAYFKRQARAFEKALNE